MRKLDYWINRRIKQLLWKQWKTLERRFQEFRKRWKGAPSLKGSCNNYWNKEISYEMHRALKVEVLWSEKREGRSEQSNEGGAYFLISL